MRPHRHLVATVGAAGSLAVLLAACSSSPGTAVNAGTSGATSKGATSKRVTVRLSSEPGVGKVLVTSGGEALYLFAPDKQSDPTCTGSCAGVWPPLTASEKPLAGAGVQQALLGTVKDANGKLQVTYDHWPLYTYTADTSPGEVRGQDVLSFGGRWWAVTAQGTEASSHTSGSKGSSGSSGSGSTYSTTSSGGGGNGY